MSFLSADESVTVKFVMQGYVTKNAMHCYATDNLVKEDFALNRSITKRCTEIMKDNFLTSVLFTFSYNSNLREFTKNAIS